jgi:NAD(P)-dependent dehydrogenase (short-subunit alcohol dehydrogenase family)
MIRRMSRYDLDGKVAFVTGAARGIGFETARALAARGASAALVDLGTETVEAAAASLHRTRTIGLAADVSDRAGLQRAVAATVERFGGLDVVVANAGIIPRAATFRAMTMERFDRVIDVNLMGVVKTVDAALPEIVRNRGHVVVVASIQAFQNGFGVAPYAMSKAAVEQFGRALRVELVPYGASASVAYFGFVDTDIVRRGVDADPAVKAMVEALPRSLKKRLEPREAGDAIVSGIERRAPRIIRPRAWIAVSALRGLLNPLADRQLARDKRHQDVVRDLDARGDEEHCVAG